MGKDKSALAVSSWLVSAARQGAPGAPLNAPPVPASNFVLGGERAYARDDGTTTWQSLEDLVGGLEGGHSVAFASGMAAIAAVFDQIGVDAEVVIPDDCYQAVTGLAEAGQRKGFWRVKRLPVVDTDAWLLAAESADLLWLESPSNPLLRVADVAKICSTPRKPGSLLAVDNTFATPLNQQPLALGADVSVQSATKFIGGHSDLLAGVATTAGATLAQKLSHSRKLTGATPGALETYLAVRGARTMALRVERAQQTAAVLAERLEGHPKVERVRYPGLASHPGHQLACQQLRGFGSIISYDAVGGEAHADQVCQRIELIQHATSLGSVESTMERRAAISGQQHVPPGLLRLSVGIEDPDDLWADLEQALG